MKGHIDTPALTLSLEAMNSRCLIPTIIFPQHEGIIYPPPVTISGESLLLLILQESIIDNENEDSDKEHTNTPFHFHKGL